MNRYMHYDGMEISMQDSFNLLQSAHSYVINAIGRMFTENPGVKEGGFDVSYTSSFNNTRHPGEGMEVSLVFDAGDVMFPNGEIFTGQKYKVRIPIEKKPGYRYVVIKHRVLRETLGYFAPGFPVEDQYLDCQDILSVHTRVGTAATTLSGDELIIARFLYTEDMAYPIIDKLQPFYYNYISVSEMIDPYTQPILNGILQTYHCVYAPSKYQDIETNRIDFLPGKDGFLHARAEAEEPSGARNFWLAHSQSETGRSLIANSMLPHVFYENGKTYNIIPLRLIKGLEYDTQSQQLDCYRATQGVFSTKEVVYGGGSATGSTTLAYVEWHPYLPILRMVNHTDSLGNCFIQMQALNNDASYMQEVPTRLTELGGTLPANLMIFSDETSGVDLVTKYISPGNRVMHTASESTVRSESARTPYMIITHQIGPDSFREHATQNWSSDCLLYQGNVVLSYTNRTYYKQYITSADVFNQVAVEDGNSDIGHLRVVGEDASFFNLDLVAPGPTSDSWTGLIEVNPGTTIVFHAYGASGEFCRFHGNIQIAIERNA